MRELKKNKERTDEIERRNKQLNHRLSKQTNKQTNKRKSE